MYLGLDLTSSEGKASAFALLDDSSRLGGIGLVGSDAEIIELAARCRPGIVAIDAPISLPRGLCCLEESCPCQPLAPDGLKAAERALYRQGIGLYATTKRSIIKAMVYRAIGLRQALERQSLTVIEVFPYACKVRLFGKPLPKKATAGGQRWLRARLQGLIPGLREYQGRLSHDHLDALVAAYTTYLYAHGRAEAIGNPQEGVIILPLAAS